MSRPILYAVLLVAADAFVVQPHTASSRSVSLSALYDKKGHHITVNPMDGFESSVDVERARVCAENFGECTVEEMEALKNNLHKERLQNFAVGGSGLTQPKEDALQHLMLEEELELQLSLLKEHNPDATLFPDDEAELKAMPHLKDDASSKQEEHQDEGFFHKPTPYEIYELEETVLEENLMEPFLICLAIAAFALAPQLINN